MAEQRRKVIQALTLAVEGLDDLDTLLPAIRDLGRRHHGYGVNDKHYESVGVALLWTLQQGLGAAWTPAVASAWSEIYLPCPTPCARLRARRHRTTRTPSRPW